MIVTTTIQATFMSNIRLTHASQILEGNCQITGSKSESNRLLILQTLFPSLILDNLSNSDDTQAMQRGLASDSHTIDIGHAGTTMRFLTSYFATTPGMEKVLTGSQRMQERPIKLLVDALRAIGADVEYLKNEGYPPLRISGKAISTRSVSLAADVSSQYITSLMLIAIQTAQWIRDSIGRRNHIYTLYQYDLRTFASCRDKRHILLPDYSCIATKTIGSKTITVESDWSSASYHFSMVALATSG